MLSTTNNECCKKLEVGLVKNFKQLWVAATLTSLNSVTQIMKLKEEVQLLLDTDQFRQRNLPFPFLNEGQLSRRISKKAVLEFSIEP